MADTYITEIEEVVDEVSDWAVQAVKDIVQAIMPDGRAFGTQLKPTSQQLDEYRLIRNNPDAWEAWGRSKALQIEQALMASGSNPQTIAALDPLNVASIMILKYSSDMEALLEKEMV